MRLPANPPRAFNSEAARHALLEVLLGYNQRRKAVYPAVWPAAPPNAETGSETMRAAGVDSEW